MLDRLKNPEQKGLIAWHSTGSGKTLTALKALQEARERTGKPGLFITPASLVENAKKEIAQHKLPLKDLEIMSYEKALRNLDELEKNQYGLIAFDEAHKLRNSQTARVQRLRSLIGNNADKTLFLTGTAGYNGPADVGALARLADKNLKFPGTPLENKDAASLNQFATGVRQASLSPMHHDSTAIPEDSPKLVEAVKRMAEAAKAPRFRGVAYSNYIDAGLRPYAGFLRKKGIEPLMFTGSMNAKEKKALVDEYNSLDRKAKILLLSSSGGEGLDLKGTRRLQIPEPHFNRAKIDQVIGRGARFRSHADLPATDRNLVVEQFHSVMPRRWYHKLFGSQPDCAIDDYLAQDSERKQNLINGVIGAVR